MTAGWLTEARELAWWTHCNIASRDLYYARQEAFRRLRAAISNAAVPKDEDERNAFEAARWLASCSDSNRMGDPYYERKAAMMTLRGCLSVIPLEVAA